MAAAGAEVAWLRGDRQAAVQATEAAFALASELNAAASSASSRCGAGERGSPSRSRRRSPSPTRSQLAGDWRAAAERWTAIGRPYEAALALADGDGEAAGAPWTSCTSWAPARLRRSSPAACALAAPAACGAGRAARRATTPPT